VAISDYELAPDVVGDDQTATAAIPLSERAGILEAMELRHTGGSWQMRDEVTISTHPQHWWGVARVIPIEPYAAQVRVIVRGTAADADVYVRARIGLQVSSVATIAAGTTDEVACVVTLQSLTRQHEEVLSVEFKSEIGDVIGTDIRLSALSARSVTLDDTATNAFGASGDYAPHAYIAPNPDSGNWGADEQAWLAFGGMYAGYAEDATTTCTANVWPEPTPDMYPVRGVVMVDTYELGRLTVHGVAWSVEGLSGSTVPSAASFAVGSYMRSSDVRQMHWAGVEAYQSRPYIWTPACVAAPGDAGGYTVGASCDMLWTCRSTAVAIELHVFVDSSGTLPPQAQPVTLKLLDADDSVLYTKTVAVTTIVDPARRVSPTSPGTLYRWGRWRRGALVGSPAVWVSEWGGADLMYAGPAEPDWMRTAYARATVMIADTGVSVRDEPYILRIGYGTENDTDRMIGVTVWERTRVEGGP
jgi:hypothetical protein